MAYDWRQEAEEKFTEPYKVFAWQQAVMIGESLAIRGPWEESRAMFGRYSVDELMRFERENGEYLTEFIRKPDMLRTPYFDRVTEVASEDTKVKFLVLAILGVLRTMRIVELRERFSAVLAPRSDPHENTAALYSLSIELQGLYRYDWPDEVFATMGLVSDGGEG